MLSWMSSRNLTGPGWPLMKRWNRSQGSAPRETGQLTFPCPVLECTAIPPKKDKIRMWLLGREPEPALFFCPLPLHCLQRVQASQLCLHNYRRYLADRFKKYVEANEIASTRRNMRESYVADGMVALGK
jgi:hypothetical protein